MWVTVGFSLKDLSRIAREWDLCEVSEKPRRESIRRCGACGWAYGQHSPDCHRRPAEVG